MTMVVQSDALKDALDGGIDFRALFNAGKVLLFKSDITPDCDTVIGGGGFVEADFTGYAAQTPVFAAATIAACIAEINAGTLTFTQTGTGTTCTVYGYLITNAAKTIWYVAERNPAGGVLMNAAGYTFKIDPLRMRSKAIV